MLREIIGRDGQGFDVPLVTADGEGAAVADGEGAAPQTRSPLDVRHDRLTGTIARATSSGSGAIVSPSFDGELQFGSAGAMPEFQGHPWREGEPVEFNVQAERPRVAQAFAMKPVLGRTPEQCAGQRCRGYVRRFADKWGFLNSPAFDGDLFVHRDNLVNARDSPDGRPLLRQGQAVEFDVAQDDRRRTVAKHITTHAQLLPSDCVGRRLRGHIRSFQGAWGFINSDAFAGDLFVHRDSLMAGMPPNIAGVEGDDGAWGQVAVFDDGNLHGRKPRSLTSTPLLNGVSDPSGYGAMMP